MITFKNTEATSNWFIDLKEYSQVEGILPLNGFNLRNDSNIVAYVDLEGIKVGEVQRYSADQFQGRNFELIRIYNPDGQEFAPDDLFIQATKGEIVSSQPFNPQWDMMFFELDRFATGTDSRISLSDSISKDMIKYWVNVQNSVVVQRRLDVQAHATLLGDYKITFAPTDVLSGAVGIGIPPPPDTLQYKKTIQNSAFDYAVTNALIQGWIIDLKVNPDDVSEGYTVGVGGGSAPSAYDDVMTTFAGAYSSGSSPATVWEVSLPATYISGVHAMWYQVHVGGLSGSAVTNIQVYDGSWHTIHTHTGNSTLYRHDLEVNKTITGIRVQTDPTGDRSQSTKIYDISVIT